MIVNGFDGFEHSIRFRYLNSNSQYLNRTHQLIASYSTRIHRMNSIYSNIWAFFATFFVLSSSLILLLSECIFISFCVFKIPSKSRKWYKITNLTWYRWYSSKVPHSKCYKFINKVNLLFLAKSFSRFILWNIALFLHLIKYHIDTVSPKGSKIVNGFLENDSRTVDRQLFDFVVTYMFYFVRLNIHEMIYSNKCSIKQLKHTLCYFRAMHKFKWCFWTVSTWIVENNLVEMLVLTINRVKFFFILIFTIDAS